jgi:hypothetical protein
MPDVTGTLRKLHTSLGDPAQGGRVQYRLPLGDREIPLNPLLGRPIRFTYTGRIFCLHCGQATRTSFSQGYCFSCMQSLARADLCMVRPETCHYHMGTCREPAWGEAHCHIEHTVYLANSSGLKVGITRSHQMQTRWMDQGAVQALPIVKVKSRRDSGLVESALARKVPDKTNWRVLLAGEAERIDLKAERDALFASWAADLPGEKLFVDEFHIAYPVARYPAKITSHNLDKSPEVRGELLGVKGQYLILDSGVLNMRKYGGYELAWEDQPLSGGLGREAEAAPAAPAFREKAGSSEQTRLF